MSSRKDSMRRRKFSFDIPKLKIGARSDSKSATATNTPTNEQDSRPTTPKSVRPPLSPRTDHQLRLACAYVLQDFKPSHQLYEERYGQTEDDRPRLSYPVVEKAEKRQDEVAQGPFPQRTSSRARPQKRQEVEQTSTLELPRMKPTIKSQAFFEGLHIDSKTLDAPPPMPDKGKMDELMDEEIRFDLSNLNPPIASPAFFAGVDVQRLRKEHLAIGQTASDVSNSQVGAEARPVRVLMRSASNPVSTRAVLVDHHPRKWPRAESADTTASSPRTDGTENAWNLSTAPTSTAATPAPGSMRQSSQSARQGSEKFLTADIEWMRSELERHKREQDEAKARLELDNQVLASLGLDTGSRIAQPASNGSTQASARKPLPTNPADGLLRGRSTNQSIQERRKVPPVAQLSATPSRDASRSVINRKHPLPRSESAQELYMHQAESSERQSASRRGSQTSEPRNLRSLSRDLREYFGTSSSDAAVSSGDDVSRASSRSRRLFQLNPRPRDGTRAPLASIESSKPQSRSRSIESIRSAVSAVAPSLDSAASKLRSWKSSRTGESTTTNDTSRSGSSLSKRHSRDFSRELQMSPDSHKRGKSSVNLNRELPPLPSIDQWKPAEPEKPKHIVSMASPPRLTLRLSEAATASAPNLADFGPVSPLPGPGTYTSSTSRIQSIYSRYSKISDGWLPPLSAGASPTVLSPLPLLGQTIDRSSIGDSVRPESFPASPAYAVVDPRQASFPASPAYTTTDELAQQPSASIPPSPAYLTVESQQQRIPSEYMFSSNFGALLNPPSPLSVPVVLDTTPPQRAVTIKRRTEDMFLPDLDARARNESSIVGPSAASKQDTSSESPAKSHIINYSRSVGKKKSDKAAPAPGIKRQNTAPILHSAAPATPTSHSKSASEGVNCSRVKPTPTAATPESYTRLYDMGYRNIVQIQPREGGAAGTEVAPDATAAAAAAAATAAAKSATLSVLPERKDSKRWWKRGTSKKIARKGSAAQAPALAQVGEYMHADESAPTVVRF